jgi:predicted HAD superfamily phosphohydrolase YqeG
MMECRESFKTIAIDFDATITDYKKFQGKCIFDSPLEGARESIQKLKEKGWLIIIYTTRAESFAIREYLEKFGIPFDYINHNPYNAKFDCSLVKPKADVYLDDRAITFTGDWRKALEEIENFAEWWKK